jgi:hypothetical protein
LSVLVLVFAGCSKTPSNPGPTYGAISGTISLPAGPNQSGKMWEVIVDTDLTHSNGITRMVYGICNSSMTVPFSVTAAAGSYYVYGMVKVTSGAQDTPCGGDFVGVNGALWPLFPGTAGVDVVNGETTSGVDITLIVASDNVTGTLTLPLNAEGKNYLVFIDDDGNGGNGGIEYLRIRNISGSSGTTYAYSALLMFPGTFYITAQVDVNNSGLPGSPNGGDYAGQRGPETLSHGSSGKDINLITIP